MSEESRPYFQSFSPDVIPYQRQVIDLVDTFDYSQANAEIMLSGSYGSAKSILMAHLAIRHCLENRGARVAICRRALPDLKRTIWREILDHMDEDFIEGVHYTKNLTTLSIVFKNGSEIISCSWADRLYKKFRSLKISMLIVEELTENDDQDFEAIKTLKARLRRITGIKQNIMIAATNPDSPQHWAYKYFIAQHFPNRFVFYSKTEDNPFIDRAYVAQLRQDLSPKEALRYLDGQWIELTGEVIYYEYSTADQYLKKKYEINPQYPIILTYDFNIAEGKPLSALALQYINDTFHVFSEVIIDGARTADTIDEFEARGLLDPKYNYTLCGDAAGKNRDTRSLKSDYDILMKELQNRNLRIEYLVPPSNPPIRTRHNRVNAYCKNANGERRLFVYQGCDTLDEGLRLTKLKSGSSYIEDDTKRYQHCTTALGYAVVMLTRRAERVPQGMIQL